jgi:hypothetical protein
MLAEVTADYSAIVFLGMQIALVYERYVALPHGSCMEILSMHCACCAGQVSFYVGPPLHEEALSWNCDSQECGDWYVLSRVGVEAEDCFTQAQSRLDSLAVKDELTLVREKEIDQ